MSSHLAHIEGRQQAAYFISCGAQRSKEAGIAAYRIASLSHVIFVAFHLCRISRISSVPHRITSYRIVCRGVTQLTNVCRC